MSDDGIGSAGTTPVEPDNPLYDAVKEGGGFVEDEDGNVTGGPDGDGTARTEEERTSSGGGGSSGSGSSGSGGSGRSDTLSDAPLGGSGGSGGGSSNSSGGSGGGGSDSSGGSSGSGESLSDASIGSAGTTPVSPDNPLYDAVKETGKVSGGPEGRERTSVDGTVVREDTASDVRTAALGDLNEATGNEGQGFQPEDVELQTTQRDGQTFISAGLTDRGQDKLADERTRQAQDELFGEVQAQTQAQLDRDDVSISRDGGDMFRAQLTDSGRRAEAGAQSDRFGEGDFLVNNSGDVFSIAAGIEGVSPGDITLQDRRADPGPVETPPATWPALSPAHGRPRAT